MNGKDTVSRWEYEIALEKLDRTIHRFWLIVIILIVSLVGTNTAWIIYESQWEYKQESTTATQEIDTGDGDINGAIINGVGNSYGESKTDNDEND